MLSFGKLIYIAKFLYGRNPAETTAGKAHGHDAATPIPVGHSEVAAVRPGDLLGDAEPQPSTRNGGMLPAAPMETIKGPRQIVGGDARAVIGDRCLNTVCAASRRQDDASGADATAIAIGAVTDGVLDEIGEQPVQVASITLSVEIWRRVHLQCRAPQPGGIAPGVGKLVQHGPHIDRRGRARCARRLEACQREQVGSQAAHPVRGLQRLRQSGAVLGRRTVARQRHLEPGAQHGERRAQLMRRIGRKVTQLRHRALQAAEHLVEHGHHPSDLVVRVLDRNAHRQRLRRDLLQLA